MSIIDPNTIMGIDWAEHIDNMKFPLLKVAYPELIAKELCSVQPMESNFIGDFYKAIDKTKEVEFFKEEEFNL